MKSIAAFLLSLGALTLLSSCGGGSGSDGSTNSAQRTGTVGILLTDKPADPSLFLSVNASIESAELLGGDDEERIELYSGPTRTFDLLRLRNEAIPFTFKDDVPVGSYCKIRLTLSDLELVLADDTPNDSSDNVSYHPKLPGNGKLDLLARDCFEVGPGEVVTLQLDIDAGNSIHVVGNNNGFNFRPVVFIDVLSQDFDSKLLRVEGTLTKYDDQARELLLCGAIPSTHINSEGCVEVEIDADKAAFFDNLEYEGMPRALDELFEDSKLEQNLTIVGWPRYWVPPYMNIEIPEGHYPPAGECKLWIVGVEPGQQSAPIDCDDLPEKIEDDTVLLSHEGIIKDPYHPLMVLDALVIELGDFKQLEGEVASDADVDGFNMKLADGSSVMVQDTLGVLLQQGETSNINGTRIVSSAGELLGSTDILAMLAVQVDGVPGIDPDTLKAALVILDTANLGSEKVTGTIDSVGVDYITLLPDADTVCGNETNLLMIDLSDELELLTVVITDKESEINPDGTLEAGQTVGMSGICKTEGYETDNVVIVEDQRTLPL